MNGERWGYYDGDRLAAVIADELTSDGAAVVDGAAAAELSAAVKHSAELHVRIQVLDEPTVERMTRRELRRMFGPLIDSLTDGEARTHARRVLAALVAHDWN